MPRRRRRFAHGSRPGGIEPWEGSALTESTAIPDRGERRVRVRHAVNSSAVIWLVHSGSKLHGRILELSLSRCLIRCDDPCMVGIYTRVEADFHLEGFPLRLGGVIQMVQEKRTVEIRFLDVSARKHAQLERLIGELEEVDRAEAAGRLPDPSGPGADDPQGRV